MIYLKNNRMYFPFISIATPENIYIETEPAASGEDSIQFLSKKPKYKMNFGIYDWDLETHMKNIFSEMKINSSENIIVNGISGIFVKYVSMGLNYGEFILAINSQNVFSLYIETECNIDDILNQDNIKNLIKSIELVDNN